MASGFENPSDQLFQENDIVTLESINGIEIQVFTNTHRSYIEDNHTIKGTILQFFTNSGIDYALIKNGVALYKIQVSVLNKFAKKNNSGSINEPVPEGIHGTITPKNSNPSILPMETASVIKPNGAKVNIEIKRIRPEDLVPGQYVRVINASDCRIYNRITQTVSYSSDIFLGQVNMIHRNEKVIQIIGLDDKYVLLMSFDSSENSLEILPEDESRELDDTRMKQRKIKQEQLELLAQTQKSRTKPLKEDVPKSYMDEDILVCKVNKLFSGLSIPNQLQIYQKTRAGITTIDEKEMEVFNVDSQLLNHPQSKIAKYFSNFGIDVCNGLKPQDRTMLLTYLEQLLFNCKITGKIFNSLAFTEIYRRRSKAIELNNIEESEGLTRVNKKLSELVEKCLEYFEA